MSFTEKVASSWACSSEQGHGTLFDHVGSCSLSVFSHSTHGAIEDVEVPTVPLILPGTEDIQDNDVQHVTLMS